MRRLHIIAAIAILPLTTQLRGNAGTCPSVSDYWQQEVRYKIDVKLDTTSHTLFGTEEIWYRNNSPDTLQEIYLHLYPNAYRDENSVRSQEMRKYYRKFNVPEQDRGWLEVDQLDVVRPSGSTEAVTPVFGVDRTVLRVPLPDPLAPGEEVTLRLSFREKVRKHEGRAGYRDRQYDFAQWYPKVAVYDENGWHAEPFHLTGEFYGEFATFDVRITVPFNYIVAATGVVVEGDPGWELVRVDPSLSGKEWREWLRQIRQQIRERMQHGDTLRTVVFHAEKVHDFAWSTSSDFLYERGEWEGIPIHVFYRTWAKNRWSETVARRGARALEWLSTRFGRYPYPQLTIVHGLLGGGMEYPMLVMNSSESEGLILHEVGHIYFYGILANNELDEAWLDEGFTTFQTRWYMQERYEVEPRRPGGRRSGILGIVRRWTPRLGSWEGTVGAALDYMESGLNEPISRPAYRFREPYAYRSNAYTKGSLFYDMLRYVVGDSVWERICHVYFDRWKFKHVNEERFKQVCEEVSGKDLDWFFDQWLHDSVLVDYGIGELRTRRRPDGKWETVVRVRRKERGVMPVEVQLVTADQETLIKRWEGFEREGSVSFLTAGRPRRVVLDPRDQVLDRNRLDNGDVRIRFYPLFLPVSRYPRYEYVVQWQPSAWYNDVDGLRLGLKTRGSYRGTRRSFEAGIWAGLRSGRVDGSIRYSNPFEALGAGARYQLSVGRLEGRALARFGFEKTWKLYITMPPRHSLALWLEYWDCHKPEYAVREIRWEGQYRTFPDWEAGNEIRAILGFQNEFRGVEWTGSMRASGSITRRLEDERTYGQIEWEGRLKSKILGTDIGVRLFGGVSLGDEPARQDLFWLEGANPRRRMDRFYGRSRGAFPPEIPVHVSGGPNLRGYLGDGLATERVVAANAEVSKRLGRELSRLPGITTGISVAAFADAAQVWGDGEGGERLYDAGFGLRLQTFIVGKAATLRIDFPVWVSEPGYSPNGVRYDKLRFRWLVGFDTIL